MHLLLLLFEYVHDILDNILYPEVCADCWSRAPESLSPINFIMLGMLIESLLSWRYVVVADQSLYLDRLQSLYKSGVWNVSPVIQQN